MAAESKAFWMVWNLSLHQPTHRHETWESARNEARRLANMHPGQRFYVVQTVLFVERHDLREVAMDDLPF